MRKKKNQKFFVSAIAIVVIIAGVIFGSRQLAKEEAERKDIYKAILKANVLSENELSFLKEEGFLTVVAGENISAGETSQSREGILSLFKSPALIEQKLDTPEETFEVLATKLDLKNNSYKLAFKLENKSDQSKDFYLIPVSDQNQAQFQEIKGVINGRIYAANKDDARKGSLAELYDVEKHKKELKPELAQAYNEIKNNNYQAKPIKITLGPQSSYIAQSEWQIAGGLSSGGSGGSGGQTSGSLAPVYFLVYGSAGGVKDDLTILNVHSHPQQGENWEVEFTTRGQADLKIIPTDQATINDDEFVSLSCLPSEALAKEGGGEEKTPQILDGDVIYYPNWFCGGTGKVVHYTKKAGKHTLKFIFGSETAFAYNSPGWTVDGMDYTTRKKLTIDQTKIDANLTDLPVLVKLTDARFDWTHSNADGYDIRFTASDGTTLLKYERERHDGADYAEYWVKVPSVSGTVDTDFYMYYRTTDTADGADPTNVWDVNYMMVQHLSDLTTSATNDSTANNNDGAKIAANEPIETTTAKIYEAQDFDGTDDYISTFTPPTSFTVSIWVKADATVNDNVLWRMWDPSLYFYTNKFNFYSPSAAWDIYSISTVTIGQWYHVTCTLQSATKAEIYVDGTSNASDSSINAIGPEILRLGYWAEGLNGILDEVRVSDTVRTAAWIKADYNSGADSLLTYGAEEPFPSNSAPTISSAEDGPDPIEVGQTINFSVDWNDADAEGIKMYICKAEDGGTSGCGVGGTWCSNSNDFDITDPISCTYAVQSADVGVKNYYVYVCDNEPTCSSATSGTFTVQSTSVPSIWFKSGAAPAAGSWTVDGMDYTTRKKLTIDQTKIDADLTDLPVLVKLTDARFDWTHSNADGFDIRFTASDGSTLLKYERERHDGADYAEYWVKIPSVSATADTIFYMYYRTTDTADGADPTNVWDTNYKAVWHLNETGTNPQVFDSTVNAVNSTSNTSDPTTSGKVNGAMVLTSANSDSIGFGDVLDALLADFTLELWIKTTQTATAFLINKRAYGEVYSYDLYTISGIVYARAFNTSATSTGTINNGVWRHVAATFDRDGNTQIYIDGAPDGSAACDATNFNVTTPFTLGDRNQTSYHAYFNESMDEVRFLSTLRTAAEIKADYNSGNDSLLTYGQEETPSVNPSLRIKGGVRIK